MDKNESKREYYPFIPAELDDAKLKPLTFRILCHIWRRAGTEGVCFESGESIAKFLGIHPDTYWDHLKILRQRNFVRESEWHGRSNQLLTNPPSLWIKDATGEKSVAATGEKSVAATGEKSVAATGEKRASANGKNPAAATGEKSAQRVSLQGDNKGKHVKAITHREKSDYHKSVFKGEVQEGDGEMDAFQAEHALKGFDDFYQRGPGLESLLAIVGVADFSQWHGYWLRCITADKAAFRDSFAQLRVLAKEERAGTYSFEKANGPGRWLFDEFHRRTKRQHRRQLAQFLPQFRTAYLKPQTKSSDPARAHA